MRIGYFAIGCFAPLILAWLVYPGLMWLATRFRRNRLPATLPGHPESQVSVVIATRDAPHLVAERVANVRMATYPEALLRIVVAVDATSGFTVDEYLAVLDERASVVSGDAPGGKAATLNAGMRAVDGADIVVFADVGQTFEPEAIGRLVEFLNDSRFGGVTGRYTQPRNDALMAAYADFEAMIRAGQSLLSVVSTSGSIYAVRASLWKPLPAGLICDDLFTTMSIVRQRKRVGFCGDAVALDRRVFSRGQQFTRRVRTLTGLIQFCLFDPTVLLPWRNPIWIHFVLHKLLRLATPILLMAGTLSLLVLAIRSYPGGLLAAVVVVGVAGIVLWAVLPSWSTRVAGQVSWVLRLQLVPAFALANGLRRRWTWGPIGPSEDGQHTGAKSR